MEAKADIEIIDVSELPAPEPLQRILQCLAAVDAGKVLKVLHQRQPLLLYPILMEGGYEFHVSDRPTAAH